LSATSVASLLVVGSFFVDKKESFCVGEAGEGCSNANDQLRLEPLKKRACARLR
jgi:hypothetical protein